MEQPFLRPVPREKGQFAEAVVGGQVEILLWQEEGPWRDVGGHGLGGRPGCQGVPGPPAHVFRVPACAANVARRRRRGARAFHITT